MVNCLFTNHMGGQICMGGHLFFTGIGGGIYSIFCVQICFIDFYWPGIILILIFSKLLFFQYRISCICIVDTSLRGESFIDSPGPLEIIIFRVKKNPYRYR